METQQMTASVTTRRRGFGLAVLFLALCPMPGTAQAESAASADTCIDCHANSDLMVSNRKLYEYFQRWRASTHGQEDVTCSDCHGGNPAAKSKDQAHGGSASMNAKASATGFAKVPQTCGQCHDDMLQAYNTSKHSEHLVKAKNEKQGPNCVTCHGSVGVEVPNAASVRQTCEKCHNKKEDNKPEIPGKAEHLLNEFGVIRGFTRYIHLHGSPEIAAIADKTLVPKVEGLAELWHTFDLKKIEPQTEAILSSAKKIKEQVRAGRQQKPQPAVDPSTK